MKCHVRIHTGAKPCSCKHCSERFASHGRLKTHLLKSHNEGTWSTCQICQNKFSDGVYFKQHLLRHNGVKQYSCSECPMRFYTTTDLRRHQPVDSNYKQFCCGLCGKDFKGKRAVVSHFKRCFDSQRFNDL